MQVGAWVRDGYLLFAWNSRVFARDLKENCKCSLGPYEGRWPKLFGLAGLFTNQECSQIVDRLIC